MLWITTQAGAEALLETLVGVGGAFNGAKIGLYKNVISLGPLTKLADLTPADFDGYALSTAVTWGGVIHANADEVIVPGSMKEFVATGDVPTNTIYGVYLVNGAGDTLLAAAELDEPVGIAEAGNGLYVVPVLTLPSQFLAS